MPVPMPMTTPTIPIPKPITKIKKRGMVTANAPRNPNPVPKPTLIVPPQISEDELSETINSGLIPDAYFTGYDHEVLLSVTQDDNDRTMSRTGGLRKVQDMMDVNIAEIQSLQDFDTLHQRQQFHEKRCPSSAKSKEYSSPQSNGSLSGGEIITNCCAAGLSGNNSTNGFLQDSYNVLSDLTDFSISDSSHKNIEMELEREIEMELEASDAVCQVLGGMTGTVSKTNLVERKTMGIEEGDEQEVDFGDEKFNILAQEIMHETFEQLGTPSKQQQQPEPFQMPPYQPYSQYAAGSSSQDYSYRYQCPVSTNIWAEPKRAQSAKTLAGLLMNGLEPISTKMFTL